MTNLTWAKFLRDVLLDTNSIEIHVPAIGNFVGLMTATHLDAPPIIQWDMIGQRNPISYYVYHQGSPARRWGINTGWNKVTQILRSPHGAASAQHLDFALFVIDKASDVGPTPLALFPEILKGELREVRAVIEAHSRANVFQGVNQVAGLTVDEKATVRVRCNSTAEYWIDRWE